MGFWVRYRQQSYRFQVTAEEVTRWEGEERRIYARRSLAVLMALVGVSALAAAWWVQGPARWVLAAPGAGMLALVPYRWRNPLEGTRP